MSRTWRRSTVSGFLAVLALAAGLVGAEPLDVHGRLLADGVPKVLTHAAAVEVESTTEPGSMDVVVLLSDRPVPPEVVASAEKVEEMVRRDGLIGVRVVFDPDAKVRSAEPLHPKFTRYVTSAAFVTWIPSAYDEEKVAGRLTTDGEQNAFGQRWQYDLTFSVPITLDPEAKTVPNGKG